jgi:hypothetical protein
MAPANLTLVVDQDDTHAPTWQAPRTEIVVQSVDDYVLLSQDLKVTKAYVSKVEAFFKPLKQSQDQAKRTLLDAERARLQPALDYEARVKRALVTWDTEQERLRQIEQRRLREEVRQRDEAMRIEQAAALERDGLTEEAEAMLEEAIAAPAPDVIIEKTTPKVEGISYRETWQATVTDPMALIRFVAAHPQFEHLLTPNVPALNGLARSLKGALAIDGVKATSTRSVAASRS